jgi:hypothetical protein
MRPLKLSTSTISIPFPIPTQTVYNKRSLRRRSIGEPNLEIEEREIRNENERGDPRKHKIRIPEYMSEFSKSHISKACECLKGLPTYASVVVTAYTTVTVVSFKIKITRKHRISN